MANCSIEKFLDVSHPEIRISPDLLAYIGEIVDLCKDEVSWVMEVQEFDNFIYEIQKVFIPTQKVNGATTEFEGQDIMELCELEPDFAPEKWRGWGHSHVNMAVHPSGQDDKQMMDFAKTCEDFFVGMIHNKKGEIFCWLIDNKRKIFFRDVQLRVMTEHRESVRKLLKERVSTLTVYTPKNSNYGGYGGYLPYQNTNAQVGITQNGVEKFGSPFKLKGVNVVRARSRKGNITLYGWSVEGYFFSDAQAPIASKAVDLYEDLIEELVNNHPPLQDMEVFEELEDWCNDPTENKDAMESQMMHGI